MSGHTLDELPDWPESTVSVLATVDPDGAPHAVPVSTALRAGPRRIVFALGPRRGSYERLQAETRASLLVMAADAAFTAEGTVRVVAEPLDPDGRVNGLELQVEVIWDHNGPTFGLEEGVRWHWTDEDAKQGDDAAHAALKALR